ncbi:MAG: (d)CMP kinase [Verrucomicrobiales bacterium]|nr:(d)CMP kinase [Verrucomicrobiales bacterium]
MAIPPLIVAIDGPAASGKSTVAKRIASCLQIVFVSSGGMYRAFTWRVLEEGIDPADTKAVLEILKVTRFDCGEESGLGTFAVDGRFLTKEELSARSVNENVSTIAAIPEVRERLVAEQRAYGEANGVVMEGRDIGSVVFPNTPYKFYIDASPEVREQRRRAEGVTDSIAARDKTDSNRKASPLVIPEDAIVVDSSYMSVEEVVEKVISEISLRRE